jgi:hypothetical protein
MEKEPQNAEHDQTSDPDPDSAGDGAEEYAERQQEEEDMRGKDPANDED